MNTMLLSINWNPNPELFNLFGISIRYYGLLWAVGIFFAYVVVHYQYRDKKIEEKKFDPLFFYCFFGILIGARLGHCLFYDPGYYLSHFWEMILPIKFMPDGNWKFTGYEGLASHGGTLGLIIALWLYCRKTKLHYMDVLDMIAVATPITACFIRLANLMNSEIIGKPSDVPWAFIFERVDMQPRHPGQLYEAIAYLILFFIMIYLYKNYSKKLHRGFFFGLCLTYIFTFRFFIEFLKENQEDFENSMMFNMGQWLSVPFIIIGVYFMFRLANLMNSEIIGKPSDVPWAFVFERVDMLPRHPGQLYEAIAYLILFFIMIYLYKNYSKKLHRGFFFGLCLTYIFTFRFFIEFLKENQEDFENSMMFNMGQWLSVPFIIIGVYFMFFYDKKKNKIA